MKVTWLTHSGLLFENDGLTILVDPYLTDSLGETDAAKKRKVPVEAKYLTLTPDVILITHSHKDHLDVATLNHYLMNVDKTLTVMANATAYYELVKLGYQHNIVLLAPHSVYSVGGVTFYAIKAEHTERDAVGFIIDDAEKTYYVSGDTLYNFDVIDDCLDLVEDGVDYAFLPINGNHNNMNAKDASDFAYEIGAKAAIPVHYGLFDDVDPEEFDFDDRIIIKPYETLEL